MDSEVAAYQLMKYIRPSVQEDVEFLSSRLREEDVEEVTASANTPFNALSHGLAVSKPCYTLIDREHTPVGMLGVCEGTYRNSGIIWLLGTKGIETNSISFLRHSKPVLGSLFVGTGYDFVYNYTYVKNELHHRWLRWLGFTFLRTITLPSTGKEFIEFVKLRG